MPDLPFTLTEEQMLSIPVEDVALAVLRDLATNYTSMSGNWVGLAAQGHARGGERYSKAAINILCEAWQWLHNKGLVAEDLASTNNHAILVTRRGYSAAQEGFAGVHAEARLFHELHPLLEEKVRGLFVRGTYELAAFEAMKGIEIRVRRLSNQSDSMIGVKLMKRAFGDVGTLRNQEADPGEQVARMEVFAGAIGLFKNPTSHRDVVFDDPTEAAEVILFADLLMRILDRIEREEPRLLGEVRK